MENVRLGHIYLYSGDAKSDWLHWDRYYKRIQQQRKKLMQQAIRLRAYFSLKAPLAAHGLHTNGH
jgi:hypothetical protein